MFVHYYSLYPQRKSIDALIGNLQSELDQYAIGGSLGSAIPFLGISYTESTNDDMVGIGHDADVAAGAYDVNLVKIIQVFKDYDKPFFIRPGFEFNGSWNGYQPGSYQDAWIHIYDKFQEMGVTKGIWVWDHMPTGDIAPFQDYYPGDEYVDYYGVNLFGSAFNMAYYKSKTTQFVNDAIAHEKPLLIPESSPTTAYKINASSPDNGTEAEAMVAWNEWFTNPTYSLFQFIHNPSNNVKGFCYSNGNYPVWNNMTMQTSWLKEEWQEELYNPAYLHETP
jgi:beta-mannanase